MKRIRFAVVISALLAPAVSHSEEPAVRFSQQGHKLDVRVGDQSFATYLFRDERTLRPYFAHLRAPNGMQVTRSHPPVEGKDLTDHATMHPGLWLAFGDLGGGDFWRNKGVVHHAGFVDKPRGEKGRGRFAVRNRYEAAGKPICEETCRIELLVRPSSFLLLWDSTFTGNEAFAFGDQEEMGLGIRLAMPLTVKHGGTIQSSGGFKNEKGVWGKAASWCAYGGSVDGQETGIVLMPDPRNFRRCWFHARDYGLLVANPFGQKAFTRGEASKVQVRPDETFQLRFGILFYAGPIDGAAAYAEYLGEIGIK